MTAKMPRRAGRLAIAAAALAIALALALALALARAPRRLPPGGGREAFGDPGAVFGPQGVGGGAAEVTLSDTCRAGASGHAFRQLDFLRPNSAQEVPNPSCYFVDDAMGLVDDAQGRPCSAANPLLTPLAGTGADASVKFSRDEMTGRCVVRGLDTLDAEQARAFEAGLLVNVVKNSRAYKALELRRDLLHEHLATLYTQMPEEATACKPGAADLLAVDAKACAASASAVFERGRVARDFVSGVGPTTQGLPELDACREVSPAAEGAAGKLGECTTQFVHVEERTRAAEAELARCRARPEQRCYTTLAETPSPVVLTQGGECLAGDAATGEVTLAPCDGEARQQWLWNGKRTLQRAGSGACLTADGEGRRPVLRPCILSDRKQHWGYDGSKVQSVQYHDCLSRGAGTGVELAQCVPNVANQAFAPADAEQRRAEAIAASEGRGVGRFEGKLVVFGRACIEADTASGKVTARPANECDGRSSQRWTRKGRNIVSDANGSCLTFNRQTGETHMSARVGKCQGGIGTDSSDKEIQDIAITSPPGVPPGGLLFGPHLSPFLFVNASGATGEVKLVHIKY